MKGSEILEDYKYIYGPVPSRRLGLSLGISPIPQKHCNYSCIYCQLGRTINLTNKREEYFELGDIIKEFKEYLKEELEFDVVTIVGEGEPTLYLRLGELIIELKKLTDKPIAVVTNGALLYDEELRRELMGADIVLPSLDAADEESFRKINRPYKKIEFEKMLEGFRIFSKDFKGQLWLETMLIKDVNDDTKSLLKLKKILDTIQYDRLYINSPVRPPAETFVEEPLSKNIEKAVDILGGISINQLVSEGFYSEVEDDYNAIISIIKRHPMNQFEIKSFLNFRGCEDISGVFERLKSDKGVDIINYKNYKTYRLIY
jgi:wyosine [tRNA(Phe)-imidazoG37] synthetase (radical SAM superfamily)